MPLWRRSESKPYRLFFVADLHGSEKCFRKFINAGTYYDVDALILGGDVTGKALVPIVRRDDGTYETRLLGRTDVMRDETEVKRVESQIRFNGFYPFRSNPEEIAALERDPRLRATHFQEVISRDIRRWVELADERLADTGIQCIVIPGNDDEPFVGDLLSAARRLRNPEGEVIELGPYQVLSYGWSNITPWRSPRELDEDVLEQRIEGIAAGLEPGKPAIFNLHVPPFGSGIDNAPEIRADLSLVGGSAAAMVPVGSHAVRRVIERHQPMLGLHGHIHESRGKARIGRSICLNPGSDYNTGILKGVIVSLIGDQVADAQFVAA
ncbi:MAG: metallophosphoesterase [Chloroflexota bacterium]